MVSFVYLDNSPARDLICKPEKIWDLFYDKLCLEFGQDIKLVPSYYLFFEVIGFTQEKYLKKPDENVFKFCKHNTIEPSVDKIGNLIEVYWDMTWDDIYNQLLQIEDVLTIKIKKYFSGELEFNGSQNLRDNLFKDILILIQVNYQEFAKIAAFYLAWDCFCNIAPQGISKTDLRKYQLDVWVQCYENDMILPLGKILDDIDGIADNYQPLSRFHGKGDLVDAEVLTNLIIGCKNEFGEYEPVHFITFDNLQVMKNRIQFAGQVFKKYGLEERVKFCFGSVYCFDENMEIQKRWVIVP